jgi:putative lipoprotein (rSAM/lipoprotein system)
MKVRFYRWYNAVLTALLSMLGYGCSSDEPMDMYGTPVPEYGAPHADYIVKGLVTDEANTPIQGIKASVKAYFSDADGKVYVDPIDSILTDASGDYQLKHRDAPERSKLIFEDIDGAANGGEFLSDTLDINEEDFNQAVKVKDGDGKWYRGVFEVTKNVKLKMK